jgi:flagellar motor component MotA
VITTAAGGSAGSAPAATGTAQPASTSKAGASLGFVVPASGVMAAVLGLLAYL